MGRFTKLKETEKRIRASKPYADWAERNRGINCLKCESLDNLEVHHVIELYHVMLGLWKLYGDWQFVFVHAISLHEDDRVEAATLCHDCHGDIHPCKSSIISGAEVRIANWAAIPRNMPLHLAHSTQDRKNGSLGLIAFQSLLGIGWHILNGYMDCKMVEFNRRRFAELLGKKPSTSFNKSLDEALVTLEQLNVLTASARTENDVELHISQAWLDFMASNPWFFPMEDISASRMSVLALKWFLGLQGNKRNYAIGLGKLASNLNMRADRPAWIKQVVLDSCEYLPWVTVRFREDMAIFTLRKRGAVPIHSLRRMLEDSVVAGM